MVIESKKYRYIFPSADWDDQWYVNQIINQTYIVDKEEAKFVIGRNNEKVKLQTDKAISDWIDKEMIGCSCLVVFVGEYTYKSKWVLYETKLAIERKMGILIVYLEGMKDKNGNTCPKGKDPYKENNLYMSNPNSTGYIIKHHHWINDNGKAHFGTWIENSCKTANR